MYNAGEGIKPYGSSIMLVDSIFAFYSQSMQVRNLGPNPAPAKKMGLAYSDEKVYMFGVSKTMRMNDQGTRHYTFSEKLFEYDLFTRAAAELPDMPYGMET